MSNHYVCITLDFDSVSLWQAMGHLGLSAISRGEFGAVAAERLLKLFADLGVTATCYIPGMTVRTYPEICQRIVAADHEVGHHGYRHIAPGNLSKDEESEELEQGLAALSEVLGVKPHGYRSPAWELSEHSVELLLQRGFLYDSSLMGHDMLPYRVRQGDVVTQDEPIQFGNLSELWELPISWSQDDFPHFEYFRGGGLMNADAVMRNWLEDFAYLKEQDTGVLTYTLHPFVIGRGHRIRMLRNFMHALAEQGAEFITANQAIERFSTDL